MKKFTETLLEMLELEAGANPAISRELIKNKIWELVEDKKSLTLLLSEAEAAKDALLIGNEG